MNIKFSKLINFFFKPKKRVYRVEVDVLTPEQADAYVKSLLIKKVNLNIDLITLPMKIFSWVQIRMENQLI